MEHISPEMSPYEDIATISSVPKINLHSGSTKAEKWIPDLITFFFSPGELFDIFIYTLKAFPKHCSNISIAELFPWPEAFSGAFFCHIWHRVRANWSGLYFSASPIFWLWLHINVVKLWPLRRTRIPTSGSLRQPSRARDPLGCANQRSDSHPFAQNISPKVT